MILYPGPKQFKIHCWCITKKNQLFYSSLFSKNKESDGSILSAAYGAYCLNTALNSTLIKMIGEDSYISYTSCHMKVLTLFPSKLMKLKYVERSKITCSKH